MTSAKNEEQSRLASCQDSIRRMLHTIDARLSSYSQEIQTRKEYLWEARRDMDHIEKISVRQSIEQSLDSAEVIKAQHQKLVKLLRSPYFGRFDFIKVGACESIPVYVGVHHCYDEDTRHTLIYDWRAPISSLFYDFESGPAHYQSPKGVIEGQITLKRQFRIQDGELEFVIESGVNIVDDVLQEELSRASDDEGMKQIVATIQRDQNAIIRNDDAHTLIIQGVAGSGKTSIALHRIAYLLYRFKDTLSSDDILIISPNRVFSDYVGNVLPELGEEQVSEVGMDDLAVELLDHQYRFQTFFEQTTQLLEKNDEALRLRITTKASTDFLRQIDKFAGEVEKRSFVAVQWRTGRKIVPDWFFAETWTKHRGVPVTERIAQVVKATESQIGIHYNYDLRTDERQALREAIRGMVRKSTLRQAYQELFNWLGQPELFKPVGGKLEYADVFPLIYLKMRLEGVKNPRPRVKHLLIDEMQDYTPVHYAVLGKLFSCRKTILGDATQSVNPYTSSSAGQIQQSLASATQVKLTKSYRSTWEIMQFALAISPNPELEAMKRHGEQPQVRVFKRPVQMIERIVAEVTDFHSSDHHSLAIISKTQRQASRLHKSLHEKGIETRLLDATSAGFSTGVIVCTAHLAKGLEFDRVIITDVSNNTFYSEMDRNLLYVACTRAMHRLAVYAVGDISPLIADAVSHQIH
ncbi:helicase [Nitrincola sp. A-D6]|uniref:HelD family protein n=1 Tax=Nitrincola sp. A-D6 TaxID=1545442 RepID=UPI00051F8BD8|nr:3'-5' exonuclease [Nitrincola sp. A-D6]KGK42135.1 helicase [Nitrincola sp. A-D6]